MISPRSVRVRAAASATRATAWLVCAVVVASSCGGGGSKDRNEPVGSAAPSENSASGAPGVPGATAGSGAADVVAPAELPPSAGSCKVRWKGDLEGSFTGAVDGHFDPWLTDQARRDNAGTGGDITVALTRLNCRPADIEAYFGFTFAPGTAAADVALAPGKFVVGSADSTPGQLVVSPTLPDVPDDALLAVKEPGEFELVEVDGKHLAAKFRFTLGAAPVEGAARGSDLTVKVEGTLDLVCGGSEQRCV